eukprot:CAMPEP_0185581894 /NCGR_PEP_ID=MMETSP0434-20130131/19236_1 /TAXON_ID=626734 ORGANISM="Favella taraikaensis, Strain Fe Narragansett Bay" /NCGR_SAMPLE_ID=MMETSP0434 /ASSEMBLY_ACC=CAM_ASM_000379 /LENGTH=221 /DNA_ID=CAMNT_0028200541 /DNA_START=147 /DNA_END=811 /DNA_ORIENTATION=-
MAAEEKPQAADPAVAEVEAEEALGVAERLRGSDRIAQVLDDVEDLSLFRCTRRFHLSLPLFLAILNSIRLGLVGLAEKELALLGGRLVELDERAKNGEPDAGKPALARTARHRLQVPPVEELHFDQHRQVVEEPVAQEAQPRQNLQLLLQIGQLASSDRLDLDILVEGLAEAEKLSCRAHVGEKTIECFHDCLVVASSLVLNKARGVLDHLANLVAALSLV